MRCLKVILPQKRTALDIQQHFLTISPDMWDNDNDYIVGQRKLRRLKVINVAERSGFNSRVQWGFKNSRGTEKVLVAGDRETSP